MVRWARWVRRVIPASMVQCVWWLRFGAEPDAAVVTALALLLVWAVLAAPNRPGEVDPSGFARLPIELLAVVALAALLPVAPRRALAVLLGVVLSLVALVKLLDLGFFTAFDRPFSPVDDSSYVGIGVETLCDAAPLSDQDTKLYVVPPTPRGLGPPSVRTIPTTASNEEGAVTG